jgi:hypothetical protein
LNRLRECLFRSSCSPLSPTIRRGPAPTRGHMVWFNVCQMMFRPQELFDCLLRPAVENPLVTRVEFVLDEAERMNWVEHVAPKLAECAGSGKVVEPR